MHDSEGRKKSSIDARLPHPQPLLSSSAAAAAASSVARHDQRPRYPRREHRAQGACEELAPHRGVGGIGRGGGGRGRGRRHSFVLSLSLSFSLCVSSLRALLQRQSAGVARSRHGHATERDGERKQRKREQRPLLSQYFQASKCECESEFFFFVQDFTSDERERRALSLASSLSLFCFALASLSLSPSLDLASRLRRQWQHGTGSATHFPSLPAPETRERRAKEKRERGAKKEKQRPIAKKKRLRDSQSLPRSPAAMAPTWVVGATVNLVRRRGTKLLCGLEASGRAWKRALERARVERRRRKMMDSIDGRWLVRRFKNRDHLGSFFSFFLFFLLCSSVFLTPPPLPLSLYLSITTAAMPHTARLDPDQPRDGELRVFCRFAGSESFRLCFRLFSLPRLLTLFLSSLFHSLSLSSLSPPPLHLLLFLHRTS